MGQTFKIVGLLPLLCDLSAYRLQWAARQLTRGEDVLGKCFRDSNTVSKKAFVYFAEEEGDAEAGDDLELKKRRFDGEPADDVHELLPIKVEGKLLKRSRKISEESLNHEGHLGSVLVY